MKGLLKNTYALTCPGQGFYRNGLLEITKKYQPRYEKYLQEIDETLNEDFSSHLFAKQQELEAKEWLGKTSNAQPAILASTYIMLKIVEPELKLPLVQGASYLMGHSLGEYTALVLSGVIDFATGLKLVRKRGQLMEELCRGKDYGMIALLIKPNFFEQVIQLATEYNVLGNINSKYQIVISGEVDKLQEFVKKLKEVNKLALMKAVPLPVSIPFHSELLKPIVPELALELQGKLQPQKVPIISNLNGEVSKDSETTMKNLLEANYQPVQWLKSMTFLEESNINTVFNTGPGDALYGINRRYKINSENLETFFKAQT